MITKKFELKKMNDPFEQNQLKSVDVEQSARFATLHSLLSAFEVKRSSSQSLLWQKTTEKWAKKKNLLTAPLSSSLYDNKVGQHYSASQ